MQNITSLKTLLTEQPLHIVITSHRNPDGDAIGSSLGLKHFLKKLGHHVTVAFPSEYPDAVAFLPESEQILIYDNHPDFVEKALDASQMIYALDYNELGRIDTMGDYIKNHCTTQTKVMIDHHLEPDDFAEYILSETTASSTAELIYTFMEQLDMLHLLDKTIGTCIFTGIITDTGSFKYGTSPRLYRVAAALKEVGVDDYALQYEIYNSQTEKQLRLLSHCLSKRSMEILPEYNTGIIVLSKRDYEDFNIQRGDTEGIVNYILKIKSVKLAILITEQPKIIKLSLRSKGDFSVQEIAQKYFKGGGHKNASGGISYQPLAATVNKIKQILPEYREALTREEAPLFSL